MPKNEIATKKETAVATISEVMGELAAQQTAGAIATSGMEAGVKWLKNLQLSTFTSKSVTDHGMDPGRFLIPLGNDQFQDLGDSIDLIGYVIGPKAIDFSVSPPVESYDRQSKTFQEIERRAPQKNSKCQAGRRILVFERSTAQFLNYFCGSSSAARECAVIQDRYMIITKEMLEKDPPVTTVTEIRTEPLAFTLKSRKKSNAKGTFFVPVSENCLTKFNKLPTPQQLMDAVDLFNNPNREEGEEVKDGEIADRRTR
jgi:hypothetical protein